VISLVWCGSGVQLNFRQQPTTFGSWALPLFLWPQDTTVLLGSAYWRSGSIQEKYLFIVKTCEKYLAEWLLHYFLARGHYCFIRVYLMALQFYSREMTFSRVKIFEKYLAEWLLLFLFCFYFCQETLLFYSGLFTSALGLFKRNGFLE